MKKDLYILGLLVLFGTTLLALPALAFQIVQLTPDGADSCYDATQDLRFGMGGDTNPSRSVEILKVQSALVKEGFLIHPTQFGTFGVDTLLAVIGLQEKYKDDILIPAGLLKGNGFVGPLTRRKLNSLYGCQVTSSPPVQVTQIALNIKGILLDTDGVSITFCNSSPQSISTFPVRVRVNGIIREFDIHSALQANTCYPAHWSYETWGLSYDPEMLYTAVVTIDPFGHYKKGALFYPDLETIAVPAIQGLSLSVRSLLFKNDTIQATFCNMGTKNVPSFPVHAVLNDVGRDFDVGGANLSGKCASVSWPFSNWGIKYTVGTAYTVVVIVNKDSTSPGNEDFGVFGNAAAVSGVL